LGFSLVLPLMPSLIRQLQMTPTEIGFLQSSNAIAQLFAVPFIGALSDKYGRRPLLIICVLGTLISFLILANATTVFWVFFSRILDGLIGGNISLAYAYVTDVTDDSNRAKGMGLIGAAFGLGFCFGPAIGGFLVQYHYSAPSYAAAALTFLNLISVVLFLKESLPPEKRNTNVSGYTDTFVKLYACLSKPKMAKLLWLRFIYLIVFTLFEHSFGFFNQIGLNNSPRTSGVLLCWFALMYSIIQGGGLTYLKRRLSEDELLSKSLIGLAICYLVLSFNSSTVHEILTLIPLGLASGLVNTLVNARVSKEIDKQFIGATHGVSAALGSLTRIIAPPLGGMVIDHFGTGIPFIICSILGGYLFVIWSSIITMPV